MTNAQMWGLIIAALAPLGVGMVIRAGWASGVKMLVAVVMAAAVGIGTAYFAGQLTGPVTARWVLTAILVTIGSYETIWRGTPLYNLALSAINGGPQPNTVTPAANTSGPAVP